MTWCFAQGGRWTGRSYSGPKAWLEVNTPDGETALAGDPAALIESGAMLPPVPPPLDEWVSAWTWHAEQLQYVPTPSPAAIARDARAERDRRLAACDWTQLPDVPSGAREAWAAYRQALRDVTQQPGFPAAIAWPSPP